MKVEVKTVDKCRRKLTIEVPAERVAEEVNLAYESLARSAKVRGFRAGKVPRKVLEFHYGSDVSEEVKKKLVTASFHEALREKGIEPAILPSVSVAGLSVRQGEPFRYEVDVDVWPEIRLSGYKRIKVVKKKPNVKDDGVDESIRMLQERRADFVPVEERALAIGDFAVLDFTGKINNTAFDERKGVFIEINEKSYIPGFCERLVEMKAGEERTFTLTLPDNMAKEDLRDREASFTVKLCEIKQKKLPPLDDDFCKDIGDYKGVEELRSAVREDLLKRAEAEAMEDIIEQIETYLMEKNKVSLPQAVVDAETVDIAKRFAAQLAARGMKEEQIIDKKEELLAAARKNAEKNLRIGYIYGEIAKREGIEASSEEVEERLKQLAERFKKTPEQVKAAMEKEGEMGALDAEIKQKKVVDFLIKNAKIKEK